MRTLAAVLCAAALVSTPAFAQKKKQKTAATTTASAKPPAAGKTQPKPEPVPTLKFDKLPMVASLPHDIYVVANAPEEVFLLNGRLYLRTKSSRWYYAANTQGYWYDLESDRVPPDLLALPQGKYRNYRGKNEHLMQTAPGDGGTLSVQAVAANAKAGKMR